MKAPARNTICLWYDHDAEEAARFYASTFPDSSVGDVLHAPNDYPSGKKGQVLTVAFTVLGIPCLGINGGPAFRHSEAFSFQIISWAILMNPFFFRCSELEFSEENQLVIHRIFIG